MVSIKPNGVEGVALREGSILRCMNVLRWDAMDGLSNIGEKGDDGPEFPIAGSKVEVVTYYGSHLLCALCYCIVIGVMGEDIGVDPSSWDPMLP
ncbi:hypothetical protein V6N13_037826 [Hibiscus sabdariffa]|uniref:Uncharacterized protein n=1 Tax=Hibiscus sabdariffa TaxID=183260 RepID=A0ABR2S4J8_9ROSI